MRLFLIRHGESVDNVANLYAGSRDSALTAHGALQARRLGEYLAGRVMVQHVFSSDLRRAVHTADAVREAQLSSGHVVPTVTQLPVLREKDFGSREGVKFGEKVEEDTGESRSSLASRSDQFLVEYLLPLLLAEKEDEQTTVCVVSHGILLSALYRNLTSASDAAVRPGVDTNDGAPGSSAGGFWSNTGYAEFTFTRGQTRASAPKLRVANLRILKHNSQDHLQGLKKTAGGIGSAAFDRKQKTLDSFFKSASRKRKLDE